VDEGGVQLVHVHQPLRNVREDLPPKRERQAVRGEL